MCGKCQKTMGQLQGINDKIEELAEKIDKITTVLGRSEVTDKWSDKEKGV